MINSRVKGSPQLINKLNKIKILNTIREHGQISRAEIAKISKISAPTVTRIVNMLVEDEHLVKEIGSGESSGGRRPTLVEFLALENFVIGIDIGKTHIDGVLTDLNATTVNEIRIKTKIEDGYDSIISRTSDIICELQNQINVNGRNIFGIGLAVGGLVNKIKNVIEISPDFHWKNVDIEKAISEKCKLPLIFDNVTRVMALGELWYGVGKYVDNFVVINVGYGIGSGIIIDRKPLYGSFGMAGEFGHITMDKNSDIKCECGNYGCLEALSSGHAIARKAKKAVEKHRDSYLLQLTDGDISAIDAETVATAVRYGDQIAIEIWDEAIDYLGTAIANIINLMSPQVVLIGGGVAQSGDIIFSKINDIVSKRTINTDSRKVKIEPVTFGIKAASKGAIALILNEVLSLNFSKVKE
ncbi:MAG: ROK family transcriptional regulator [Ignavibacteriaceae bacterium]